MKHKYAVWKGVFLPTLMSLVQLFCVPSVRPDAATDALVVANSNLIVTLSSDVSRTLGNASSVVTNLNTSAAALFTSGPFKVAGGSVNAAEWNPQANILAVGGTGTQSLRFFRYISTTDSFDELTPLAQVAGTVKSLAWSPSGKLLAVGTSSTVIMIYKFSNAVGKERISQLYSGTPSGPTGNIYSLDWRSDNKALAVGSDTSTAFHVFRFDNIGAASTLTLLASANPGNITGAVKWNPTGSVLAVARGTGGGGLVYPYTFTYSGGTWTLTQQTSYTYNGVPTDLQWSPSGTFLAMAGSGYAAVVTYSGTAFVSEMELRADFGINSISWNSDGTKIAVCGQHGSHGFYDVIQNTPFTLGRRDFGTEGGGSLVRVRWKGTSNLIFAGDTTNGYQLRMRKVATQSGATRTSIASSLDLDHGARVWATHWHPKGQYLAIGGVRNSNIATTSTTHRIYSFNQSAGTYTEITSLRQDHGVDIIGVRWSPNGQYLAVCGSNSAPGTVRIYRFDDVAITLTEVANLTTAGNSMNYVTWDPTGVYIAVGSNTASATLTVYEFDSVAGTITQRSTADAMPSGNVNSVDWRSDGAFILTAGAGTGNPVKVFPWNYGSKTIGAVTSSFSDANSSTSFASRWSPNGAFVAVAQYSGTNNRHLAMLSFNGSTLTLVASVLTAGLSAQSLDWAHDGRHLVVAYLASGGVTTRVFGFDGTATLTEDTTQQKNHANNHVMFVSIHPDQEHYAIGGDRVSNVSSRVYEVNLNNYVFSFTGGAGTSSIQGGFSWDPTGQYVALPRSGGTDVEVYSYSSGSGTFSLVTTFAYGSAPQDAQWNPLGTYIAVAATPLKVLSFNGSTLTEVATAQTSGTFGTCRWSPNGLYLAVSVGGSNQLKVYTWNSGSGTLTLTATASETKFFRGLKWRDNQFLAAGDQGSTGNFIYNFSSGGGTLTQITTGGNLYNGDDPWGNAWRPQGDYLATVFAAGDPNVRLTSFDGVSTAANVSSGSMGSAQVGGSNAYDVTWSSDGTQLFVASGGGNVYIFSFNTGTQAFTLIQTIVRGSGNTFIERNPSVSSTFAVGQSLSANPAGVIGAFSKPSALSFPVNADHGADLNTVAWHPTLNFVAVGGVVSGGATHRVYEFNTSTGAFTSVASADHGATVRRVAWSKSGNYLGIGGEIGTGSFTHRVYSFNSTAKTITSTATYAHGASGRVIDWNFDDSYIMVGGYTVSSVQIKVAPFTGGTLGTLVSVPDMLGGLNDVNNPGLRDAKWSPVANFIAGAGNGTNRVVKFIPPSTLTVDASATLVNNQGITYAVAWHPDGSKIVYGAHITDFSTQIYTYNSTAQTLTEIVSARPNPSLSVVTAVDWSKDGSTILRGSSTTYSTMAFDSVALTQVQTATFTHGSSINGAAFSPNGSYCIIDGVRTSSITSRLHQLKVAVSGNTLTDLTTTPSFISPIPVAAKWNPTGTQLATVSGNNLYIYSYTSTNTTTPFVQVATYNHGALLNSVDWSPNGQLIACGGAAGTGAFTSRLLTISGTTLTLVASTTSSSATVYSVAFDSSGSFLSTTGVPNSGAGTTTTRVSDVVFTAGAWTLNERTTLVASNTVFSNAWRPQGDAIAKADGTNLTVNLFTRGTPAFGANASAAFGANTKVVAWHPLGSFVAVGGVRNSSITTKIYSYTGTPTLTALTGTPTLDHGSDVTFMKWSPDGSILVTGGTRRTDGREFSAYSFNSATQTFTDITSTFAQNAGFAQAIDFISAGGSTLFFKAVGYKGQSVFHAQSLALSNSEVASAEQRVLVSANNQLAITKSQRINLSGKEIIFAQDTGKQLFLDAHVTVTAERTVFDQYSTSNASMLRGASLTVSNGSSMKMRQNENLQHSIYFDGNVVFDGGGHTLNFTTTDAFYILPGATLRIVNARMTGLTQARFQLGSSTSTVIFDNVRIDLTGNFAITNGKFQIAHNVSIRGPYAFIYNTDAISTVLSKGVLKFEQGATLVYNPPSGGINDIQYTDSTAAIFLSGSNIYTSNCNMQLSGGQLNSTKISSLASLSGFTPQQLFLGNTGAQAESVQWRPDGLFVAVGSNPSSNLKIFSYNTLTGALTQVVTFDPGAVVSSVSWDSTGTYLAIGHGAGSFNVRIFTFDGSTLSEITAARTLTTNGGTAYVSWSTNNQYLAVTTNSTGSPNTFIYQFASGPGTLTQRGSNWSGYSGTDIRWRDNQFVSVARGANSSQFGLTNFSFTGSSLDFITTGSQLSFTQDCVTVDWHPSGNYLVVSQSVLNNLNLSLYAFNSGTQAMTYVASGALRTATGNPLSIRWSPDGTRILVGTSDTTTPIRVYDFNSSTQTFTENVALRFSLGTAQGRAVAWRYDGQIGAVVGAGASNIATYSFQTASPTKFLFGDGTSAANNLLINVYDGTLSCTQGEIFWNNLDT